MLKISYALSNWMCNNRFQPRVQSRGAACSPPLCSSTPFTVALIWRRRRRGRGGGVARRIRRNACAFSEVNTICNCCYFRPFSLHQQHRREKSFRVLHLQCTHNNQSMYNIIHICMSVIQRRETHTSTQVATWCLLNIINTQHTEHWSHVQLQISWCIITITCCAWVARSKAVTVH